MYIKYSASDNENDKENINLKGITKKEGVSSKILTNNLCTYTSKIMMSVEVVMEFDT